MSEETELGPQSNLTKPEFAWTQQLIGHCIEVAARNEVFTTIDNTVVGSYDHYCNLSNLPQIQIRLLLTQ